MNESYSKLLQALILIYLSFWLGFNIFYFSSNFSELAYQDDFNHYYASAWLFAQEKIPYCIKLTTLPLREFVWAKDIPSATNTPFHIFITQALAQLPPSTAWITWISCNFICGLIAIWIIIQELPFLNEKSRWLFCLLAVMGSYGFLDNLFYAQIQLILFLLVVCFWKFIRNEEYTYAALSWGILMAIKPLGFLLIFALVSRRLWKACAIGLGTFLLANLLPTLHFGQEIINSYLSCALPIVREWSIKSLWNIGLIDSIFRLGRLFNLEIEGFMRYAECAIVLLVVLISFGYSRNLTSSKRHADILVSFLSLLGSISLVVAWPSYLVFSLLPLAVIWNSKENKREAGYLVFLFWALINLKPIWEIALVNQNAMLVKSLILPGILCLLLVQLKKLRESPGAGEIEASD